MIGGYNNSNSNKKKGQNCKNTFHKLSKQNFYPG